jgi:hypothetical protein
MNIINQLFRNFHTNYFGKNFSKRIVVFESDDWGSIRMPNKKVYETLLKKGIPVDKSAYCKYDTLESGEDVTLLAEVFGKYKNKQGFSPKLTMNFVSANPDFHKIDSLGREKYFFEPFKETYKKSPYTLNTFDLIVKGISEKLFLPQFHGRDHVNVPLWFDLLKKDVAFKLAFDYGMWGLSRDIFPQIKKSIQATYDSTDFNYTRQSVIEGLVLFEQQFGFKSISFIPNNYIWANALNEVLKDEGIVHLQGMKYQLLPYEANEKRKKIRRTLGSINYFGQTYAPRNCAFEPTELRHDYLFTLKQISSAFFYKKPAIISTHRINYVGGLDVRKRDQNLFELDRLLKNIIQRWPDVTFIFSNELHSLILKSVK